MNQQIKLILALRQIDSLVSLLKGNDYENFIYGHLINIKYELRRQLELNDLTHSNTCTKIKE